MANPYDSGGPVYVGENEPNDPGLYDYLLSDSASTPTGNLDFSNMSASDISNYAQTHPEWFQKNASLVDYWLNEKSYDRRSQNNIISQYEQLTKLGVNPVLAMSLLNGSIGTSLSGGASASSDSFFASKYSSDTSSKNNVLNIIRAFALIGISIAVKALL